MIFSKELLERFRTLETPFYYYDLDLLQSTLDALKAATYDKGYHVHYAMKANTNTKVVELIRNAGLGADCVSGGEVKHALESGFTPDKIVFAGVGKSDREIKEALEAGIFCFNCESLPELEVINDIAGRLWKKASVALRINPNVESNTHHYITTGLEENKFGIGLWELDQVLDFVKKAANIELIGLHVHIGSQITDYAVFRNLCVKVNTIQQLFEDKKITLKHINMGGGLGIDYHQPDSKAIPDFAAFFEIFQKFLELRPGQQVHFELGRALVAQCGSLISRVIYVKKAIKTKFLILDAGMTELLRPALYQAYHKIENISKPTAVGDKYDVVGPICESSDCFGKAVELPAAERGDLIAIRSAGAYGEVMASQYNLREQQEAVFNR